MSNLVTPKRFAEMTRHRGADRREAVAAANALREAKLREAASPDSASTTADHDQLAILGWVPGK